MKKTLFRYFVSGQPNELVPGSGVWNIPLSGNSHLFGRKSSAARDSADDSGPTIGAYLSGCAAFLGQSGYAFLLKGISACRNINTALDDIRHIDLSLEKHGVCYHPVKVTVVTVDQSVCRLVLNGAVSENGLGLIEQEAQLMTRLGKLPAGQTLPGIYAAGFVQTNQAEIGFILGRWMTGFNEFHLTGDEGHQQVVVWEPDDVHVYYSLEEAKSIYAKAAEILTGFYDLETGSQIFPWHHAAGDFIVKGGNGGFDLSLVTIRGYGSLSPFEPDTDDPAAHILPSLFFFFLHMTFWLRLDRLDGVGDLVLAEDRVIPEIVSGFLKSLDEKSDGSAGHENLRSGFVRFFLQFGLAQLVELCEKVVPSYPALPEETRLLMKNSTGHCSILESAVKSV